MSATSTRVLASALAAAAIAVFAAGCGAGRPPLSLPAADSFRAGTCRQAADPVLALGRFAYDRDGAKSLAEADYTLLVDQGNKLLALRDKAEPDISRRISAVLTSIGFVRIRPGTSYDPQLLRDLEAARLQLQNACL
jgi:hypothetical protein